MHFRLFFLFNLLHKVGIHALMYQENLIIYMHFFLITFLLIVIVILKELDQLFHPFRGHSPFTSSVSFIKEL